MPRFLPDRAVSIGIDEARKQAKLLGTQVAQGHDPHAERIAKRRAEQREQAAAATFEQLYTRYAPSMRSGKTRAGDSPTA